MFSGSLIQIRSKALIADKNTYHAGIDLDLALDCCNQNIVSSLINNCYTDLQVALGIVIGKKTLIQDFFHFGVSCSYEEVLRYKDSAAAAAVRD